MYGFVVSSYCRPRLRPLACLVLVQQNYRQPLWDILSTENRRRHLNRETVVKNTVCSVSSTSMHDPRIPNPSGHIERLYAVKAALEAQWDHELSKPPLILSMFWQ